jgi:CheY-like chemotaxis protein/HPt (histidine-containing phosphotransfer) domain-containing protein
VVDATPGAARTLADQLAGGGVDATVAHPAQAPQAAHAARLRGAAFRWALVAVPPGAAGLEALRRELAEADGAMRLIALVWSGDRARAGGFHQRLARPVRERALLAGLTRPGERTDEVALDPGIGRLRVLVVDDDPGNRRVARAMLRRLGHRVRTAGDAEAAYAACLRRAHDVVLTDLAMPGGDGYDLARLLRTLTPAPRLIGCTAAAPAEVAAACRAAGIEEVLAKPLDLDRLAAALRGAAPPAADAPDEADGFDHAVIDRHLALRSGRRLVRELIGHFARDADAQLAALGAACAAGDATALGRAAHHLAGSARNLGLRRVAALCGLLERDGLDGAPARLAELARAAAEGARRLVDLDLEEPQA